MSSFRPIAPQPRADVYAAACNPPRRAKRPRDTSPSPSPPDDHHDDDDQEEEEDNGEEEEEPRPPKRRGRRPGTLSRAAREAQRKINHSLIEKARRTKINDALATLRVLVPPEYKQSDDHDDRDDDALDPKRRQKTKPAGEKEFKLEILVRTVAYLQDLTDRVHQLEHSGCPRCSEPISLVPAASKHVSPRLPSISAWLPEEQRALLLTPPALDQTAPRAQLPTPPASATCPPVSGGFSVPPVLTLPSPNTLLPSTSAHMQPRFSGFTRANARSSPLSSPVYTPDDETAASLLLRMSNTSPRHPEPGTEYALTPGRLLGLGPER